MMASTRYGENFGEEIKPSHLRALSLELVVARSDR